MIRIGQEDAPLDFRDTCRYVHDEGRDDIRIVKTEDCGFWLEGSCRFTDRACRNIHDTNKRGTKPKQEPRRSFGGSTNGSFLGHGNPAGHTSQGQKGAGQGLQLVTAGGQVFLQQGGKVLQQVQPVLGQLGGQQGVQLGNLGAQGQHGQAFQGGQVGYQAGQFNSQQAGLGGWL